MVFLIIVGGGILDYICRGVFLTILGGGILGGSVLASFETVETVIILAFVWR